MFGLKSWRNLRQTSTHTDCGVTQWLTWHLNLRRDIQKYIHIVLFQEAIAVTRLRHSLRQMTGNIHFYRSGSKYVLFKTDNPPESSGTKHESQIPFGDPHWYTNHQQRKVEESSRVSQNGWCLHIHVYNKMDLYRELDFQELLKNKNMILSGFSSSRDNVLRKTRVFGKVCVLLVWNVNIV